MGYEMTIFNLNDNQVTHNKLAWGPMTLHWSWMATRISISIYYSL